jgi:hypothetical protein
LTAKLRPELLVGLLWGKGFLALTAEARSVKIRSTRETVFLISRPPNN